MKIALIDPVGGKMGMNHYNDGLMNALAEQGFSTFIISNYKSQFENVHSEILFDNLNKSHISAAWNNFKGMIKSVLFCRRKKMDYLLFHIFRGGIFDLFSILLSKIFELRIILIVHDIETIDTTTNKFVKRIVLSRKCKALVVHNQYSAEKLKKFLRQKEIKNLFVIAHGNYVHSINTSYSHEEACEYFGMDASTRYLLFYGQIKKSKGLDVLLEAMHCSTSGFKLIIAGKLRIKNFDVYQKIIDRHGLNNRIVPMLKYITAAETDRLFAVCDAVVLPYKTIYQSGVLLLAMSYGKTVIASDLAPFTEIIRHGENGLLFKNNNTIDLAEILDRVYLKKFNLDDINREARQQVEQKFSWQQIAGQYARLFD